MGYKDYNKPNANNPYSGKTGYFTVINESKYIGDHEKIIYRSSLELKFCQICDKSPKIIRWASEPLGIKYRHPYKKNIDGSPKVCTYYTDFYVEVQGGNGIVTYIIEVKPLEMLKIPNRPSGNMTTKRLKIYNDKLRAISVNKAKSMAADMYCKSKNMIYKFLTDNFFNGL
jgi:hypothetical protein